MTKIVTFDSKHDGDARDAIGYLLKNFVPFSVDFKDNKTIIRAAESKKGLPSVDLETVFSVETVSDDLLHD